MSVLLLAQRWVEGTPTERFSHPMVEALVCVQGEGDSCAWTVYSAFYDAKNGKQLHEAFEWWNRGRVGMMPHIAVSAADILSRWSLPPGEATAMKDYVERLEALTAQMRQLMGHPVT